MWDMAEYRKAALKSPYRSLDVLTTLVVNIFGNGHWQRMERLRGSEFHRAREESPFVAGASRVSAWRSGGQTQILEPRDDMPTPAVVDQWLADLGKEPRAALQDLAGWLQSFRIALYAAVSEITGGTFHVDA
jgi:hypothetical protein